MSDYSKYFPDSGGKLPVWDKGDYARYFPPEKPIEATASAGVERPPEPSIADRARRVAGLGARAVGPQAAGAALGAAMGAPIGGVGAIPGAAAGAGAATILQLIDILAGTQMLPGIMDKLGLPQPETPTERISSAVTSGMAGGASQLGALRNVAAQGGVSPTVAQTVADQLTQQPGRQIASFATASGAGAGAREAGAGPWGQAAATLAGGMIPFGPQMLTRTAPNTVESETLRRARDAGYVVPPSQLPYAGPVTRKAEGFGGKILTAQEASLRNQQVTDSIAKRAIGLTENDNLSVESIHQVRQRAAQPYQELARLSPQADTTLNALRDARNEATAQFRFYERSANPDALRTARAADQQAHQLEAQLEQIARSSGRPELVRDMRQARALIARTYDVERALNVGDGHIDARLLGRALDRGRPLDRQLETVARFAEAYPKATQPSSLMGSVSGDSPFNFGTAALLGTGGYGATGSPTVGAILASIPFARGPVRSGMLSEPYQNMLMPNPNQISQQEALMLGLIPGVLGQR